MEINMEQSVIVLNEDEFVQQFIDEMEAGKSMNEVNNDQICSDELPIQKELEVFYDSPMLIQPMDDSNAAAKPKRRANLTDFGDSLTTKRKNETAKRELTSVVNQLGKIDKQLNTKDDKSRVEINFVAKFTSYKSNRVSNFKYPLDAGITQTLLDYDTTISAVKIAVKEVMNDVLVKELPRKEAVSVVVEPSNVADNLATPTKTIAAFTTFPSPVAVRGQPVASKNLCAKNSCTFGKRLRKHVWIKCCYRNENESQGCSYWVHAPCIGFPSLKEGNVKMLDGWCCPEHTEIVMKKK